MIRSPVAFPTVLMLETTSLCNSRCTTCPHGKVSRPAMMDVADFEGLVDECAGRYIGQVALTFYGEPLLDPHIVDRVAKMRDVLGVRTSIGFFTNGSKMTSSLAAALLHAGLGWVSFSVDGATAKSYESVRRGLKYDEVVANIHSFLELNTDRGHPCRVRIHMTATEQTLGEVTDFRGIWLQVEGVDDVTWLPCDGRGGEDREPALQDGSSLDPCSQPFSALSVLTDGTVVMCCIDYAASVFLGNVFKDRVEKIWTSEEYGRIRQLHNTGKKREIPLCAECKTRY